MPSDEPNHACPLCDGTLLPLARDADHASCRHCRSRAAYDADSRQFCYLFVEARYEGTADRILSTMEQLPLREGRSPRLKFEVRLAVAELDVLISRECRLEPNTTSEHANPHHGDLTCRIYADRIRLDLDGHSKTVYRK